MDYERTQTGDDQKQAGSDQTQTVNDPKPEVFHSELEVLKLDDNQGQKDEDKPQSDDDHSKMDKDHAQAEENAQTNSQSEDKPPTNNQSEDKPPTIIQSEDKPPTNNQKDVKEPQTFSLISLIIVLLLSVTGLGVLYAVYNQPASTTSDPTDPTNNNNVVDPVNVVVPDPANVNGNGLIQDPLLMTRFSPFKIGVIVTSVVVLFALVAVGVYLYQLNLEQERLRMEEEERIRLELERQREMEEQRQRELEEQLQREQEEERRREEESKSFKGYMLRVAHAMTKRNILIASFVAGVMVAIFGPEAAKFAAALIISMIVFGWILDQVDIFLIVPAFFTAVCGGAALITLSELSSNGLSKAVSYLVYMAVAGAIGYYTA